MLKNTFFKKSIKRGTKYVMLTAYDALTSRVLEAAGVDFILVGDSVGMVLLGYPNTSCVTMDEMIHHAKAVRRGAPKSCVVGDLPKKGVEKGPKQALLSAKRFRDEAKINVVKIEWGKDCLRSTESIVRQKIAVQGHVGLTPQAVKNATGFRLQGKTAVTALKIFKQAKAFESAGASLLLLECIPWQLAKLIQENVSIPTIGIGAGPYCDGQVLVFQDLIGMFDQFKPKFVRRYAETSAEVKKAVVGYARDVRQNRFPGLGESFSLDGAEFEKLRLAVKRGQTR